MKPAQPILLAILGTISGSFLINNTVKAQVGPLNFETPGQYTGNFYAVSAASEIGQTTGLANNYVQLNDIAGLNGAFYYGVNSNTSLEPTFAGAFTVQFDVSAVTANSAFGVYLVNASNPNDSLLAYFNLDYSGTTDKIRFFMDGNPANATSTAGTQITTDITGTGGSLSSGSYIGDSGLDVSGDNYTGGTPVFGTMDVTYTPGSSPNTTTLSLTLGTLSATAVIPDSEEILDPEVAIRMVDAGNNVPGTAKIDNFSISESPMPVPEPSTLALAGLGLGLAAVRASRKKLS
jgi:hypothetical protein